MIRSGVLLLAIALGGAADARLGPNAPPFTPGFEAVADTRLLMEGMVNANYRSVGKLLKNKPADRETWVFVRGQAILIAESGNLLLLRPPRGRGATRG